MLSTNQLLCFDADECLSGVNGDVSAGVDPTDSGGKFNGVGEISGDSSGNPVEGVGTLSGPACAIAIKFYYFIAFICTIQLRIFSIVSIIFLLFFFMVIHLLPVHRNSQVISDTELNNAKVIVNER